MKLQLWEVIMRYNAKIMIEAKFPTIQTYLNNLVLSYLNFFVNSHTAQPFK